MTARFCRVALDSRVPGLDRPFDYEIPSRLLGRVAVGSVVRVVLHGRRMRAFVTELLQSSAVGDPRPLSSLVSAEPLFGPEEIRLGQWVAERYVVPLGLVLHEAVPGRFSTPAGRGESAPAPSRTGTLAWAGDIGDLIARSGQACVLPPTLRDESDLVRFAAGECAAAGGRMLVIAPRVEVAESLVSRLPEAALMHGSERPLQRAEAWAAGRDGRAWVLIGGRSALMAPLPGLKLVCVVSAHDRSLKSERAPRLHGLVVAMRRARQVRAAFLASTPAPPPELAGAEGVDLLAGPKSSVRAEIARPRMSPVSPRLIEAVRWAVDRGRDALVFVGRRGDTLRLRCRDCGWTPTCAVCGAGLAPNPSPGPSKDVLVCRVCGEEASAPDECGACGGELAQRGWGHERVARALERSGLAAPVVRVVAGVAEKGAWPRPAVVVGTLAAARGSVEFGTVCVADLDQLLMRPDFRAAERALQTLHELAAVVSADGRFLVQTREPDHHAVQSFTRRSYRYFLERELQFRKETSYPPFGVVVRVDLAAAELEDLRHAVAGAGAGVVGAVPRAGRLTALVRAPSLEPLLGPLRSFQASHRRARIDVDPVDVL